ncbi:hypothetical protein CUN91_00800 [Candidatus Carsonella ruddii]|uniref:10 kDa chaperonin n=1 Tax=Carsonella ruddii TaxID=114186 RepID=A0A2K8K4F9_CARRU|nr:co-chaperone GroES [Candidatus Carsonella ruddii]ATX33490.1 hypothetical protein CUN91_00800 [Candidatus Carsonella ruddii]
MDFIPLYDKIVVIKLDEENKIGSIYIPKNENNILKGKIIKIGCGKLLENGVLKPLIVNIGDIIIFKDSYNIEKYKVNEKEYFFLKENDIISIIK